jgi:2-oxoisovalerate dehydrogenase E1 component
MPKSQNINPKIIRKPQFIEFGKIPVNQYKKTIEEEKNNIAEKIL